MVKFQNEDYLQRNSSQSGGHKFQTLANPMTTRASKTLVRLIQLFNVTSIKFNLNSHVVIR